MLWFPSWHAYSNSVKSFRRIGIDPVQEHVHVSGSVTVNSYSSVSASTRVKRSTSVMFADDPVPAGAEPRGIHRLSSSKFAVSTTRVSPSQWPRESPDH